MDSILPLLPHLNALFNLIAAVFLVLGYRAIRQGKAELHKKLMLTAFAFSTLFLTSYLIHKFTSGDTPFTGEGPIRYVYFFILITHVILAMLIVPLAVVTIILGLVGSFQKHRKFARITFPIWMYVSVTGVLVYLFLYQLYPASNSGS